MKKILTLIAVLAAFNANAGDRFDKFLGDGKYGPIDLAMQGELDNVYGKLEKDFAAQSAGLSAMSMLPLEDGSVSVAIGNSSSEAAIATGYSDRINEKIKYNVGANVDTEGNYSAAVGVSFEVK